MLGCPDLGILNVIFLANPNNFEPNVMTYMLTYGLDGTSTRSFAQLQEAHVHHKFREDYLNGPENASVVVPPVPAAGDGYYYYSDNLSKITLPAMVIADDTCDLTMPEDIHNFYLWKGRNPVDVFMRVPDTAHADIVCGLKGPSEIWPEINKWVKKLPRQK